MKYACESSDRDSGTSWARRQHLPWLVEPKPYSGSSVPVTMRYLRPNLEAKVQSVAKPAPDCDNSVTVRPKVQQLISKVSQLGR
jgi:hypothetical protein